MVPADSDDIMAEYEVLLNELREFNPDLMDKPRVLAISKYLPQIPHRRRDH